MKCTGAKGIGAQHLIQELWSGYGKIFRLQLEGSTYPSVVVKHVELPSDNWHPRGWNSDIGHNRKVKSYQVETNWYEQHSKSSLARVPNCLAAKKEGNEVLMILEDLDAAGFSLRKQNITWSEIKAGLAWLAHFHASYLGTSPDGLWPIGTYWHLETRPQELDALTNKKLKAAAPLIDEKLNNCTYQTFVHGDAKLANFCFSPEGQVAGVDFQYVGGGCGMKDVAYFIGSCLHEKDCERLEDQILDTYFKYFHKAYGENQTALEQEWRKLYRVAWADFHRFIKGWSPGHWKINSYSERVTAEVIKSL